MNDRRQALLGRFRRSSRERAERLLSLLKELGSGQISGESRRDFARELHTLKGDALVVGLEAIAEVCHAAEELYAAVEREALGTPAFAAAASDALERIVAVLADELDAAPARAALAKTRSALGAMLAATESESERGPSLAPPAAPSAELGPAADAASEAAPAPEEKTEAERWIDVPARRVDTICEGLTDLASDFRQLAVMLGRLSDQKTVLSSSEARTLSQAADRCQTKLVDLISSAWSLRMVPLDPTLSDLARHARELAETREKQLDIVISSEGVAVERSVIDELWEPLLHVVRNAVDHGIEHPSERGEKGPRGRLDILARSLGPNLFLAISDDGRGIDPKLVRAAAISRGLASEAKLEGMQDAELMELVFLHGLTTRATANDISGRGLGLDVVRSKLQGIGGQVSLKSEPGVGTRFELLVPSTLSVERTLVVQCGHVLYGLPAGQVLEVVELTPAAIEPIVGGRLLKFRGESLPLHSLNDLVDADREGEDRFAAIVDMGARRRALGIAGLVGERELLRRPTDGMLSTFDHVAASAILDDGRVVLLLSLQALLRRSASGRARTGDSPRTQHRKRVLVVDDSVTVRDLLVELLSESGFEVTSAENGRAALALAERGPVPDLVLTDLEMPVMDGFELLKHLRARWQYLPIVLLTTRGSAADRRQATALGADAYLVKSEFQEGKLLEVVRRFVTARAG